MAERMPCRELFMTGPMVGSGVALFGPPVNVRAYAEMYEHDGIDARWYSRQEAPQRLAFLQMLEDRSLMEMPDG